MGKFEEHQRQTDRPPAGPADASASGTGTGTGAGTAEPQGREYRATELAEAAGITPRTLRFYRERRLLPPPRREGRIAWYDERHLARLHTIAGLLARGHTLGGIAELIVAFEKGRDSDSAAELLGVSRALAPRFSEETTVRLTPEQLAALFPEEDTPENLSTAIELGYLSIEGDEITHISQRLLDASTMLVDRGVPLSAVLEAGRRMRRHVEAISADFAGLIKEHLLTEGRFEDISDAIEALRPSAKQVVEAELSMAMDRQLRREIEEFFNLPEERRGPSEGDARD